MRVLGWVFLVLLIAAAVAGGVYGYGRYEGFLSDAARHRARIVELEAEVAKVGGERDAAAKRVAVAQDDLGAMKTEVAEVAMRRVEAEKRRAAHDAVTAAFQPMVDARKLEVVRRGDRLAVTIRSHELFGRGSADLSVAGKQRLTEVAEVLKKATPGRRMMIGGHTDDLPIGGDKFRSNWDLSSACAATVTQFLVAAGVEAKNLSASGFAEFEPVGDNKTAAGQQANRRIELVLMPTEVVAPAGSAAVAPPAPAGSGAPSASAAPASPPAP